MIAPSGFWLVVLVSLLVLSSSSGMPQHWQISLRGEPKRVLIETSNSFDNSFNVSVLGVVSPFSQRDTA